MAFVNVILRKVRQTVKPQRDAHSGLSLRDGEWRRLAFDKSFV